MIQTRGLWKKSRKEILYLKENTNPEKVCRIYVFGFVVLFLGIKVGNVLELSGNSVSSQIAPPL